MNAAPPPPEPTPAHAPRPNLLRQFLWLAGCVLVLGALATGFWINAQIERIVIQNAGAVTALYVDAMISPAVQQIDQPKGLDDAASARLDGIVRQGALAREVSAFKLWDRDGRVIFSTRPGLIGQPAKANPRLAAALAGQVHATRRHVTTLDAQDPQDLVEVYSPVRSAVDGRVIGVAEFYTGSAALRADLFRSRVNSWLAVAAVTLAMFAALFTLFARGARTIRRQRQALADKIAQLSASGARNAALARQVEQANLRIGQIHDLTLQRLSADLHDGPAQQLGFAALRLDGVAGQEQVACAVNEALTELRLICRGLVLPDVQALPVVTILRRAVAAHQARTGAEVSLQMPDSLPELSPEARTCAYRFVQETLNNGFRHSGAAGMSVCVVAERGGIAITVSDAGCGFDPGRDTAGLGLIGLRERVRGLRGEFRLHSTAGQGTSVGMWLPPDAGGDDSERGVA